MVALVVAGLVQVGLTLERLAPESRHRHRPSSSFRARPRPEHWSGAKTRHLHREAASDSGSRRSILLKKWFPCHYGKHHQTYMDKLNEVIADKPEADMPLGVGHAESFA
jgi:hypothetical protein